MNYQFFNYHPKTCRRTVEAQDDPTKNSLKRHAAQLGLMWAGDNLFLIKHRRDSESVLQALETWRESNEPKGKGAASLAGKSEAE